MKKILVAIVAGCLALGFFYMIAMAADSKVDARTAESLRRMEGLIKQLETKVGTLDSKYPI
jgi:hypothetical protein